jgi:hypothetical protein
MTADTTDPKYTTTCEHGLLPLDESAPVRCVLSAGHDGAHETPRGVRWMGVGDDEPSDDEEP